ncbi:hypothetical protein MTO96_005765 [Rhipicephalus appendiculatus]
MAEDEKATLCTVYPHARGSRFILWPHNWAVACPTSIVAVSGGKVALPCDISRSSPDDSVTLVLWYKDESLAPIFTIDSRKHHVDQVGQPLAPGLERRLFFDMGHSPAHLRIDPVKKEDAGKYRCRVDFRSARSVNTVINMKVIDNSTLGLWTSLSAYDVKVKGSAVNAEKHQRRKCNGEVRLI